MNDPSSPSPVSALFCEPMASAILLTGAPVASAIQLSWRWVMNFTTSGRRLV